MWGLHRRLQNIFQFTIPVSGSQFSGSQAVFTEVSGTTARFANFTGPTGGTATFESASIGRIDAGAIAATSSIHANNAQAWITRRDLGTVSSSVNIDFSRGNNVRFFLSSSVSCSVTLSNLQTGSIGVIEVEYSGSTDQNVSQLSWPSNVRTPNNAIIQIQNNPNAGGIPASGSSTGFDGFGTRMFYTASVVSGNGIQIVYNFYGPSAVSASANPNTRRIDVFYNGTDGTFADMVSVINNHPRNNFVSASADNIFNTPTNTPSGLTLSGGKSFDAVQGVDVFTVYRQGNFVYLNVYGQRFPRV